MEIKVRTNSLDPIVIDTIKGYKNENLIDNIKFLIDSNYIGYKITISFLNNSTLIKQEILSENYNGENLNFPITNEISIFEKVKILISLEKDLNIVQIIPIFISFQDSLSEDAPPM